ncbi:MAG: hypothetical protein AAFX65_00720 [Cyanobacteria bacterium J06638_7]
MTGVPGLALRRVPARQRRLSTAMVMGGAALFPWGGTQQLVVLASFLLGCWTWMIVSLTHLRIGDFIPSSTLASSNLQLVLVISIALILLHAVLQQLPSRAPGLQAQDLPLRTAGDR